MVYALKQEKLGKDLSHVHKNTGYVWMRDSESAWEVLVYTTFVAIIDSCASAVFFLFLNINIDKSRKELDKAMSLFFALGIITFCLNVWELIINAPLLILHKLIAISEPTSQWSVMIHYFAVGGYWILSFLWGVYSFLKAYLLPAVAPKFFSTKSFMHRLMYVFIAANISLFTNTFAVNIVPVFVLTYASPHKLIMLGTQLFVFSWLYLAVIIHYCSTKEKEHKHTMFCVVGWIATFAVGISLLLFLFYSFLVSAIGEDDSVVYRTIGSLVPSAFLGMMVYLVKEFLMSAINEGDEDSSEESNEPERKTKRSRRKKR